MAEATVYQNNAWEEQFFASAAVASGEIIQTKSERMGVFQGLQAAASGDKVACATHGGFLVTSASATTFSAGDDVCFNTSTNLAIAPSASVAGDALVTLGTALAAKASGTTAVTTQLAGQVRDRFEKIKPVRYEFDCEGGGTDSVVLIPASQNHHGLIITKIIGQVTEQFGGGTEDQGIVTVSDESDNALATLTASDAGADAVNDIIVGYLMDAASTGDSLKIVAAGEYVDAAVTQQTTGTSAAGKMKVIIEAIPLI